MGNFMILIPPSEGKRSGGRRAPWGDAKMRVSAPSERLAVMNALATALSGSEASLAKLFGVKGSALAEAIDINHRIATAPTMPAIDRYSGVLYDALDVDSLPAPSRRRLNQQVLILSGLFGVVAPKDPIPNYKLKMGATLPGVGKLASFWKPVLGERLTMITPRTVLWNLLPNEHNAAFGYPALQPATGKGGGVRREFSAKFYDRVDTPSGSELRVVNHWNKLLKGALVRWLLESQATTADALVEFEHPLGYMWRPELDVVDGRQHTVAFVRDAS